MNETCLLIKTKNEKMFLTHEKNMNSLIEFVKIFGAEMHRVEPKEKNEILDLKDLTAAICDSEWSAIPKYKKIEKIYPKNKKERKNILAESALIKKYIKDKFLSGQTISLKDMAEIYKDQKLSNACLCNHLSTVRKEMAKEGHIFKKVGTGCYQLEKQ